MSTAILIIGESGTGKSTSIRTLPAKETFIINVLDKTLPFRCKSDYQRLIFDKETKLANDGNYYSTTDVRTILNVIKYVNDKRPDIKYLILDDWQYTMASEFMEKALIKGYEKFSEMGQNAWNMINAVIGCRPDMTCFVLSHSDTDINGKVKCKTIGKMLDDKVVVEGMFPIVLHSLIVDGQYQFMTQNNGTYLAKSPMGMFQTKLIDNDLGAVSNAIHEYYAEDIL